MQLGGFPRTRLAHLPTPLEPMPRLAEWLGGPHLLVKRDDCTGLATGGNKTRKLEFLMADAATQRADTIVTVGAVQSNHVRQTAAAAARLGFAARVLLEERVPLNGEDYSESGNVLLDRLLGAEVTRCPAETDTATALEELAETVRREGGRPYIIPGGGSNPIGALGYVNAAYELLTQLNEQQIRADVVIHATGSAGTQAGLAVGFLGAGAELNLLGISVSASRGEQEAKVLEVAAATGEHLGRPGLVSGQHIQANDEYVGDGYGLPTAGMLEALSQSARREGLLLDPVYSGKAMAGLIDLVRRGSFTQDQTVVFWHTGGSAGLFAYRPHLET